MLHTSHRYLASSICLALCICSWSSKTVSRKRPRIWWVFFPSYLAKQQRMCRPSQRTAT